MFALASEVSGVSMAGLDRPVVPGVWEGPGDLWEPGGELSEAPHTAALTEGSENLSEERARLHCSSWLLGYSPALLCMSR